MPSILERNLCSLCHLFPQMATSPGFFCAVCVVAFRKKALSDRMLGMLADRDQRDEEWRINLWEEQQHGHSDGGNL